jgi:hypothetical protein
LAEDKALSHAEELSADNFATHLLMDKVDECASIPGTVVKSVKEKRQVGIYFGTFCLALLLRGGSGETDTHPSLQKRIDAIERIFAGKGISAAVMATVAPAFALMELAWPGLPCPRFPGVNLTPFSTSSR